MLGRDVVPLPETSRPVNGMQQMAISERINRG